MKFYNVITMWMRAYNIVKFIRIGSFDAEVFSIFMNWI